MPISEDRLGREANLLRRAKAGDKDAFCQVMEAYTAQVLAHCQRLGAQYDAAEDATQEAFIKAWRNLAKFDPARPFGPWILAIVQNVLRERWRQAAREPVMPTDDSSEELQGDTPPADDDLAARDLLRAVQQAASALPPRQYQVFAMIRLEGRSISQVASELGLAEATVRWNLKAALDRIQQAVSDQGLLQPAGA